MSYDKQSDNGARFTAYISRKEVRAAKITKIVTSCIVAVGPDDYVVSFNKTGKPTPQVGWYIIFYEDGYISFCPPEQFEKGYTECGTSTGGNACGQTMAATPRLLPGTVVTCPSLISDEDGTSWWIDPASRTCQRVTR